MLFRSTLLGVDSTVQQPRPSHLQTRAAWCSQNLGMRLAAYQFPPSSFSLSSAIFLALYSHLSKHTPALENGPATDPLMQSLPPVPVIYCTHWREL